MLVLLWACQARAVGFDQPTLDRIFAASFEVVIAKPTRDAVVYERELPLDLLPFQYRNDKYYSVGTAFRSEDGSFVSAAHVLELGSGSQHRDLGLRDAAGKVYPLDKILKYSRNRDFVVFSVKGVAPGPGLAFRSDFALNRKVYAVGNALGDGVVIRDGLYTSDTAEEVDGEWKWMRFSAAASPGNSGGPLLDEAGQVVGVILRKSENENLNYALPIREVVDFKSQAHVKLSASYRIDITNETHAFKAERVHKLPMDYRALDAQLEKDYLEIANQGAQGFLNQSKPRLFPNDPGSTPILYNSFVKSFPSLLVRGSADGVWDTATAEDINSSDTGNGGRVRYAKMGSFFYVTMKRPDNVDADAYYDDSKAFMEQMLKGIVYTRDISTERIRVVSMGKAVDERAHVDAYGRKWRVRTWLAGFSDQKFVVYALPTPEGYAAIVSVSDTAYADMMEIDLRIVTDYLYYSYYGTLTEWERFIKRRDLTPAFMKDVKLQTDYKTFVAYEDRHFRLKVDDRTMKITRNSDLQLNCAYYKNGDKVVWGPVGIAIGEDKSTNDNAAAGVVFRPPKDLDESYRRRWEQMIVERTPYDGKTSLNDQMTGIVKVVPKTAAPLADNDALYTIAWRKQGKIEQDSMEQTLGGLLQDFEPKR
jgi:hypothetical protein